MGHNLKKLYQGMWLVAGVITWTLFLQGVSTTKFGRTKKCPQFGAIFDNFRLRSRISPRRIVISQIRKVVDQLHFILYGAKKFGEKFSEKFWSSNKKVIGAYVDPHK